MFFYTENMMKFAFSSEMPEQDNFESGYAIMGVPFDSTTSYKSGSRYGPKAVREASYNFETYNLHFDKSLTVDSYDIGDIYITNGNYEKTNEMIIDTVLSVLSMGLKPIVIGGEHTITNGVLKAIYDYDEDWNQHVGCATGVNDYLYTKNLPEVDLLIRTGSQMRLSNFLLYQLAYSLQFQA